MRQSNNESAVFTAVTELRVVHRELKSLRLQNSEAVKILDKFAERVEQTAEAFIVEKDR